MLYLAYENSQKLRSEQIFNAKSQSHPGIWKAALINFFNPNPWLYWVSIGVPLLLSAWRQNPLQAGLFLLIFYGSMMLALTLLIFLFSGSTSLKPGLQRFLLGFAVICLLGLALYQLISGFRVLF